MTIRQRTAPNLYNNSLFFTFISPSLKSKFLYITLLFIQLAAISIFMSAAPSLFKSKINDRFALHKIKRTKRSLFRGTTLIDIHRYPLGAYNAGERLNFHLRLRDRFDIFYTRNLSAGEFHSFARRHMYYFPSTIFGLIFILCDIVRFGVKKYF